MTRLDTELVSRGLARSRAEAVRAIAEERVRVDGVVTTRAAHPVDAVAVLEVSDPERWVARSAHKLIAALDAFGIAPEGRLCLDVGASTGGFTQVLLERGAREVIALDVGHGQLVDALRTDDRVRVVEGSNARDLGPALLEELAGTSERPSLAVVDVSFIPLRLVLAPVRSVLADDGAAIVLVKPQFEVGRVRDGVVADRALRHGAVRGVLDAAGAVGFETSGLIASPLLGTTGNREYLCALRAARQGDPTEWTAVLAGLD